MIVHGGRSLNNIDSFASSELNHGFKKSGRGDFFNTLSYYWPWRAMGPSGILQGDT
jgi:hypothetical protein